MTGVLMQEIEQEAITQEGWYVKEYIWIIIKI